MSVRQYYIGEALKSFTSLNRVLEELTEDEVLAALELETATLRRKSVADRLLFRAARLRNDAYLSQLQEKFKWPVSNPKS